jgi:hypothetical protein
VKFRSLALIGMLLSAVPQMNSVSAGPDVTLTWNTDTDPNSGVLGHRVLCGPKSGDYSIEYEVGDSTLATITLPDSWTEYYLAVVAYNSLGLTSEPSNEVIFRPRIAPTLQLMMSAGNELVITWNSIPGTGYRVLHCPEFGGTNWTAASPLIVADRTTTRWSATIDESVPSGFFQVEVVTISDAPPELRLATPSPGLLELSWNTVPGNCTGFFTNRRSMRPSGFRLP